MPAELEALALTALIYLKIKQFLFSRKVKQVLVMQPLLAQNEPTVPKQNCSVPEQN